MSISLTFRDGSKNQLSIFPAENKEAPVVLISPAMGVRASYYQKFAENFASHGVHACTLDYRGTGSSSLRASRKVDFGYEDLVWDLQEASQVLAKDFPHSRRILLGHSLGGQIGALCMSRFPDSFEGLVLIAACMVYYKGWEDQGMFRIKLLGSLFPILASMLGYFPGKQVGFGGREARSVMQDWGLNALKGIYKPRGSTFDYEAALANFSQPVLAMSLEGDNFAPQKAVDRLVQKLGKAHSKKQLHVNPTEAGTESFTHFNWVKDSDFFVKQVRDWVAGLAARATP